MRVAIGNAAALCLSLSACMTAGSPDPVAERPGSGECNADGAQRFVGQSASQALGEQIATATGARTFQWVGPNMAVTMDYRPDRVRVAYDENMIITSIRCG